MNNLFLSAFILAASGALWFAAHTSIASARAEIRALAADRDIHIQSSESVAAETRRLVDAAAAKERELERLRVNVQTNFITSVIAPEPPSNPRIEGHWPKDRPYFYLSKKFLDALRYNPLTDSDTISDAAAKLMGMTEQERAAASAAYGQARDDSRRMELQSAYPTNAPDVLAHERGEKTSLFIPKLPPDQGKAMSDAFHARLRAALGAQRGDLLLMRIAETYDRSAFGIEADRTVTLIRSGKISKLAISSGGGYTMNQFADEDWEREFPREYAHLFRNSRIVP